MPQPTKNHIIPLLNKIWFSSSKAIKLKYTAEELKPMPKTEGLEDIPKTSQTA